MQEGYELLVDDLGEDDALAMMRDRAYENILVSMRLGQFDNPYCSTEHTREVCGTEEAYAYGVETEANSIVMLKNSGTIQQAGEKKTVYIPYTYTPAYSAQVGPMMQNYDATFEPCVDLELAAKYFNVVTDTLSEPTGENGSYTADDIVRASAEDISGCDMILLYMIAPQVDSVAVYDENDSTKLLYYSAPSIQYEPYTATTAREVSSLAIRLSKPSATVIPCRPRKSRRTVPTGIKRPMRSCPVCRLPMIPLSMSPAWMWKHPGCADAAGY